jgi:hypothetical protein
MVTNVGDRPITASFPVFAGTLSLPEIGPGQHATLQSFTGCVRLSEIETYEVNFIGEAPSGDAPTGEEIARKMGFVEPHSCSGDACGSISLEIDQGCVWLKNRGPAASVEVHLGDQTVSLLLKPSRREEDGTSSSSALPSGPSPAECTQAQTARAMLDDLRARGTAVADPPELSALLSACESMQASSSAAPAPGESGDAANRFVTEHDAFTNTRTANYWARIDASSGCVADVNAISDYVANTQ